MTTRIDAAEGSEQSRMQSLANQVPTSAAAVHSNIQAAMRTAESAPAAHLAGVSKVAVPNPPALPLDRRRHLSPAQRVTLNWVRFEIAVGTVAIVFMALPPPLGINWGDTPAGTGASPVTQSRWVRLRFLCSIAVSRYSALRRFLSRRATITVLSTTARSAMIALALCIIVDSLLGYERRKLQLVEAALVLCVLSVASAVPKIILVRSVDPARHRHDRAGLAGWLFTIFNLRFVADVAGARLRNLLESQTTAGTPWFKPHTDPRIAPTSVVLRRYSLDELPKLFNVLGGSISSVGPRPQRPAEVALYSGDAVHRLGFRPGMTSLWQSIPGRFGLSWAEARPLDIDHAHNWSLLGDLCILAGIRPAVIAAQGAP